VSTALDENPTICGGSRIRVSALQYQRHKLERRLFLGAGAAERRALRICPTRRAHIDMRKPRIDDCHDLIPLVLARQYLAPCRARHAQWLRDVARLSHRRAA